MGIVLANVRGQVSLLSGTKACSRRRRVRSAEGTGISCVSIEGRSVHTCTICSLHVCTDRRPNPFFLILILPA